MGRARAAVDLAVRWARTVLPLLQQPFSVQLAVDPFDAVRVSAAIARRRVIVAQTLCVGVVKVRLKHAADAPGVAGELLGVDPRSVSAGRIETETHEPWRRSLRWEHRNGVLALAWVKLPAGRSKLVVSAEPMFNVTWFRK